MTLVGHPMVVMVFNSIIVMYPRHFRVLRYCKQRKNSSKMVGYIHSRIIASLKSECTRAVKVAFESLQNTNDALTSVGLVG